MNKLIIASPELKAAISKLGNVVSAKHALPVLSNILCQVTPGEITMVGTNTEITICYTAKCESVESFEFLLPFEFTKRILSVVAKNFIALEIQVGKKVKILAGEDMYELKVAEKIADFPKVPEMSEKGFGIDKSILHSLTTAMATVAKDPAAHQQALSSVLLSFEDGKVTVASSDGAYSVYSNEVALEAGGPVSDFLINHNVIKVLDTAAEVTFSFNDKFFSFQSEGIEVVCTRSEYKFVNFRAIFPTEWPGNLTIDRNVTLAALAKCALANDQLHETKLDLSKPGIMNLQASDNVIKIDLSVAVVYEGTVTNISVHGEKLLTLLGQIDEEEVELAIHSATKAIIITSKEQPGYKGLLMPIAVGK